MAKIISIIENKKQNWRTKTVEEIKPTNAMNIFETKVKDTLGLIPSDELKVLKISQYNYYSKKFNGEIEKIYLRR